MATTNDDGVVSHCERKSELQAAAAGCVAEDANVQNEMERRHDDVDYLITFDNESSACRSSSVAFPEPERTTIARRYDAWDCDRVVVDTSARSVDENVAALRARLA